MLEPVAKDVQSYNGASQALWGVGPESEASHAQVPCRRFHAGDAHA